MIQSDLTVLLIAKGLPESTDSSESVCIPIEKIGQRIQ